MPLDFNGLNYSDLTNERPILLIPATGARLNIRPYRYPAAVSGAETSAQNHRPAVHSVAAAAEPSSAGIGKNHFYRIGGQSDAVSLFADDKPQPVGTVRICMPDSQPEVVASATFFRSQCWSEHKLLKRIPHAPDEDGP